MCARLNHVDVRQSDSNSIRRAVKAIAATALLLGLVSTLLLHAQPLPSASAASQDATIIVLQEGFGDYWGGDSTEILASDPDSPHLEFSPCTIGNHQTYSMVVRFSLDTVPANATITRATLALHCAGWSGKNENVTVNAYAMLRPVVFSELTWNQAQHGRYWWVAGAKGAGTDRRAAPESTLTTSGPYKWYYWDLTALVRQWLNGSQANNGVLLESADPADKYSVAFGCVAGKFVDQRPKLMIELDGPTSEPTATFTPMLTATNTPVPSVTPTRTLTPVPSVTPTRTATPTITPTRQPASLMVTKIVDTETVAPGAMARFTLAVMNDMLSGDDPGISVTLRDQLPAGLEVLAGSLGGGLTYNAADHVLTWHGAVPHGGSIALSYRARLVATAQPGSLLRNELQVTDAFGQVRSASASITVATRLWTVFVPYVVLGAAGP
jgi:uncharacterized repeat protein (TIGR01451 family)